MSASMLDRGIATSMGRRSSRNRATSMAVRNLFHAFAVFECGRRCADYVSRMED